jgi:hypothetical protein
VDEVHNEVVGVRSGRENEKAKEINILLIQ